MSHDKSWTPVALLWLAGNALRLTILAVPPVLALVQADLGLSGTEIGILAGLPVVLFAFAAVPGSLLIARYGALATLIAGMLIAALGGALRGAAPNVAALYGATVVMGIGVAVMQPSLPPLVRAWLPQRIGFGSAVFTNGLLVGEILPVALTATVLLPLLGGGWRLGLALWSLPMFAIAVALYCGAPRGQAATNPHPAMPARWWPDWRDGLMWRLGLVIGAANSLYFAANAFLPGHLAAAGRPDLISAALTSLNVAQIPASLLLLAVASRLERKAWPIVALGVLILAGIVGIPLTGSAWTVVFAGVVGFAAAAILAISLAFPGLLYPGADVGRVAAAMFTIGYALAVLLSVLGGVAWDVMADPRFAFLPVAFGALPLLLLAPGIDFDGARR
jgi:CP family cyanate transporter-like MFS transporter